MFVYGLELRSGDGPAFVGSSVEQCERFMRNNTDYTSRKEEWWWVVLLFAVDHDIHNDPPVEGAHEVYVSYDWDANRLDYEPIGGYRDYKLTKMLKEG